MMKNMKFKKIISSLTWNHKKFWGSRYRIFNDDKVTELLIYHKRIYVLKEYNIKDKSNVIFSKENYDL